MAQGLSKENVISYEYCKNWINTWIASKDEAFSSRNIRLTPERWHEVVTCNDEQNFHYYLK